mgnify:CR=1 FL=1|jgi:hypothetical protein
MDVFDNASLELPLDRPPSENVEHSGRGNDSASAWPGLPWCLFVRVTAPALQDRDNVVTMPERVRIDAAWILAKEREDRRHVGGDCAVDAKEIGEIKTAPIRSIVPCEKEIGDTTRLTGVAACEIEQAVDCGANLGCDQGRYVHGEHHRDRRPGVNRSMPARVQR